MQGTYRPRAPNILTVRLRRLVEHGVFKERVYHDRPVRVEYRLTAKGRDLYPVILALLGWADRWYAQVRAVPGRGVRRLERRESPTWC